ncbi:MAG: hypothetical protein R3E31_12400 [Chloroflexota bacterium]
MDFLRERPIISILIGVVVGFAIGLLWGWFIDPVEWTDASPAALHPDDQAQYIRLVAENFSQQGNTQTVQNAFRSWPGADATICQLAAQSQDSNDQQRLTAVATILNGQGCGAAGTPATSETAEEDGGGGFGSILFLFLLLVVLVIAIIFVLGRRNAALGDRTLSRSSYEEVPETGPVASAGAANATAVPIARFRTTYTRGHDAYDDSFSIENASGDFLGECGVGISESLGSDAPKNVTAFEVWLFDKNDIRTITKVVMSDHAFFDDAIKAKLATKGEQVLAREGETIVLETASLIINAEVMDMQYGAGGTLPPQSHFETVTFELSAWAKEGSGSSGGADDMMNF